MKSSYIRRQSKGLSLPKKRHEAWQSLLKKDQRQIVFQMAILLRLSVSLNRRPEPTVSSIEIKANKNEIAFKLSPYNKQDLSLEIWSMMDCAPILRDNYDIELRVTSD